jgi:endonuclease III
MKKTHSIIKILDILKKYHKNTMLEELSYFTPFQITIATLLSARSKDVTVIPIVVKLFEDYPTVQDLIKISQKELEKRIFKIGFYKTKAKNIKLLCERVIEEFDGNIPNTLEGLISLPGVGRKTANCVLAYSFNTPAIAVDVHVHRISNKGRLYFVDTKTPEETEQELMKLVPKKRWHDVNRLLVDHGQRICGPKKPKCDECSIRKYCEYEGKGDYKKA